MKGQCWCRELSGKKLGGGVHNFGAAVELLYLLKLSAIASASETTKLRHNFMIISLVAMQLCNTVALLFPYHSNVRIPLL